jgi:hypothetical protein
VSVKFLRNFERVSTSLYMLHEQYMDILICVTLWNYLLHFELSNVTYMVVETHIINQSLIHVCLDINKVTSLMLQRCIQFLLRCSGAY